MTFSESHATEDRRRLPRVRFSIGQMLRFTVLVACIMAVVAHWDRVEPMVYPLGPGYARQKRLPTEEGYDACTEILLGRDTPTFLRVDFTSEKPA